MDSLILAILIAAAVGSGMMAGLFCSFSYFIMKALAQIPSAHGMGAMQAINRVIVRPAFLAVFLGTGAACLLAVGLGWQTLGKEALTYAIAGGAVHVIGSVIVTIACNVPLNDRLAAVDPESDEGATMWQVYLLTWTRWNHVRSVATIASTVLLILAVLHADSHA